MALSSPGIGSNLDVNSIVSQLMAVEQQPLRALATKEASYQAKLTAFGAVKSALSQFQTAAQGLSSIAKFQGVQATSSDSALVSVAASSEATPGTYNLNVTQRAQAQKLISAGVASEVAAIGAPAATTTLTFDFGTIEGGSFNSTTGRYADSNFTSNGAGVKTITINSSNNSLAGIRDAINNANIGVTATIINDGSASPYRLALTSNSTGKTNSIKISASGDATVAGLLGHNPAVNGGQGFSETAAAQNAEFKIDGVSVSKPSNTVTDVIKGMTLTLSKDSGTSTITVARNSSSIINSITAFVKAYNDISSTLRDAMAYNSTTKQGAILNGEAGIRSIQSQIRSVLSAPIEGGASAFTVLSQVGVTFQKDGTLAMDSAKLQKALDTNFNDIAGLFATVGKASDSLVAYSGSTSKTKPGAYPVTITQLARQASTTGASAPGNPGKGSVTGSTAAGLNIGASNDTLTVQLDGVTQSISLTQKLYGDATELVNEVQSQIDTAFGAGKATVSQTDGVLKITSTTAGTSSVANITGGNGKANLLGNAPQVIAGSQTSITQGVNDTLQVQLDGATATITLGAGNYSFASLAAEIQSKINGNSTFSSAGSTVAVTQSSGVLTITSNRYGSASTAQVTGGTGKTDLFGNSPGIVTGQDVAGTINGASATGSGQVLTASSGNAEGLGIKITGGSIGARGTINFSQGYAYQLEKLASTLLGTDGPIAARTDGINASLKSLASSKERLNLRLADTEKRLRAQFTALDTAISSMKKTSDFLTQQLSRLSSSDSN